jgi:hypothetical protein
MPLIFFGNLVKKNTFPTLGNGKQWPFNSLSFLKAKKK